MLEGAAGDPSIYETDFRLDPAVGPEPGLLAVDHMAQALPMGRMDRFLLFYKALFGFVAEPLWEVPDAMGLIQSRTLVSPGGSVRLPLNISEGRETTTARFLATLSGAGVQHIALACADIQATLRMLVVRGARFLAIPANYYDDIAARWGLDHEKIVMLRDHNLLYDRDETGEFLHVYTNPFDDRFFFEIVQRIGGYRQYGAANA